MLTGIDALRRWRSASALCIWLVLSTGPTPGLAEPSEAPVFTLHLLSGADVASSALRGKVIVLNFWASWCVPCKRELADLDAAFVRHGSGRLAVFAIDAERVVDPQLLYRQAALLHIPIATAITGYRPRNNAVPTTFVIDRDGRIVLAKAGALKPGEIESMLDGLLGVSSASGSSH